MKSLLSIVVLVFVSFFSSAASSCEDLPLLQVSVGNDTYDTDGALYDVVNHTLTFECEGKTRTVTGRFKIATIDGEIKIINNHLVLHPSQVEESISVVLPEDQRYGLVNLGEELLDAVANTYGYGTDPSRDLSAYFREHPEEVIPELN